MRSPKAPTQIQGATQSHQEVTWGWGWGIPFSLCAPHHLRSPPYISSNVHFIQLPFYRFYNRGQCLFLSLPF